MRILAQLGSNAPDANYNLELELLGISQVDQILKVTTLSLNLTGDEPDREHDLLSHDGGKGQVVLFVFFYQH